MTITRYKGDTYPIVANLKANNLAYDLTGSTVKFKYYSQQNPAKIIDGNITNALQGEVMFLPTLEDFQTAGNFTYEVEYRLGDIIITFIVGTLSLKKNL